MLQIAYKKPIQESKFVLDMMARTAAYGLRLILPDVQDLLNMYAQKKPNTKKILKLLQAGIENEAQNKAFSYLKQYIRSLDLVMLGKFLRFVRELINIAVPQIEIAFTKPQSAAARHPVAHTCGPLLEIPTTYPSYPDFRADFQLILESNYLEMCIV